MFKHDPKACFVGLPNFIKYNRPESPNVVTGWIKAWDLIPECTLKDELYHELKDFTKGLGKAFQEAFAKGMPKTMLNQEQEQEQDKRERGGADAPPAPKEKKGCRIPDDFPAKPELEWAASECPQANAEAEAEKFRDYWSAVSGQRGVKLDWPATWRNWIRRSVENFKPPQKSEPPMPEFLN
jgi:hypothetical protein